MERKKLSPERIVEIVTQADEVRMVQASYHGTHIDPAEAVATRVYYVKMIEELLAHIRAMDAEDDLALNLYPHVVVEQIVDDLTGRKGLRHEWDQIDKATRNEIKICWANILIKASGK